MSKRLYFKEVRQYDLDHDESFIRLLEMEVDAVTQERGIILQFWKDTELYGMDEAFRYLEGYLPGVDLSKIKSTIKEIKDAVREQ